MSFTLRAGSVVFLCATAFSMAQQAPRSTPAVQAIIDRDTANHLGDAPESGGPLARDLSSDLTTAAVDKAVRKVADWELARSSAYWDQSWTSAVLYTGFMAAGDALNEPRYRNAMTQMAERFHYRLGSALPNADDQSIAQTYLELYLKDRKQDTGMVKPTREALDSLIGLDTVHPGDSRIPWWWCDALFMAPPVWARMYAVTGESRYIDYIHHQWNRTYTLLWDREDHLYARDANYVNKLGANGRKVFWSRGEGWVMGGLVRTLQYLPKDDAQREFYVRNLKEMAARLAQLQGSDGMWRSSLLDEKNYPSPEVSGSALIVYGMAWGINEGILDRSTYKPVVEKAWRGMVNCCIYADGRLGNIQQTGYEPANYLPASSFNYGVGGFLLAGSELHRMAAKETSQGERPRERRLRSHN